jgi:nitrate reductase beta subunit
VCAETCVGRLRYIGLVLYDADRVLAAASAADEKDLYAAQREVFLDPADPEVVRAAERAGIPHDWVRAAQRSPVWALISRFEVALPLHPEYRTLPMVLYIPPLSPVVDVLRDTGHDAEAAPNLFGAIDALRIPLSYLAALFTAGEVGPVRDVLARLAAMRSFMRDVNLGREPDVSIPAAVGMSPEDVEDMYRLLALAKYDERYVIPRPMSSSAMSRRRRTSSRNWLAPWTTKAVRAWVDPARSANPQVAQRRSRWRTSTRCGSGRRRTPSSIPAMAPSASTCSTGTARAAPPG